MRRLRRSPDRSQRQRRLKASLASAGRHRPTMWGLRDTASSATTSSSPRRLVPRRPHSSTLRLIPASKGRTPTASSHSMPHRIIHHQVPTPSRRSVSARDAPCLEGKMPGYEEMSTLLRREGGVSPHPSSEEREVLLAGHGEATST